MKRNTIFAAGKYMLLAIISIYLLSNVAVIAYAEKPNIEELNILKMSVEYNGEAGKLISSSDNFFEDFGELMPADIKQGTIFVNNTDTDTLSFNFCTEIVNNTNMDQYDRDLLEKVQLDITKDDGTMIYNGNLGSTMLNNENAVDLGAYKKGDGCVLTFRLKVPAELDNVYALAGCSVKWIFNAVKADKIQELNQNIEETAADISSEMPGAANKKETAANPVNTGDISNVKLYIAVIFAGSLFLIGAVKVRNKNKHNHDIDKK